MNSQHALKMKIAPWALLAVSAAWGMAFVVMKDPIEKQGVKPKITMSNNPLESIRMLVSIGLGWSVLPKTLINQDLQQLDINLEMNRQLGMVWHPGRTQSKAAQALVNFMQQPD